MTHTFSYRFSVLNLVAAFIHALSSLAACAITDKASPGYLAAGAGFASAIGHAYLVVFVDGSTIVSNRGNLVRWCDYAVSSTLMLSAISILCFMPTMLIVAIALHNVTLMMVTAITEAKNNNIVFYISCVTYTVGVWVPMFSSLDNPPEFVYAIIGGLFVVFSSFAFIFAAVSVFHVLSVERGEGYYMAASLTAKLALQWTIVGGASRDGDVMVVTAILACIVVTGLISSVFIVRYLDV